MIEFWKTLEESSGLIPNMAHSLSSHFLSYTSLLSCWFPQSFQKMPCVFEQTPLWFPLLKFPSPQLLVIPAYPTRTLSRIRIFPLIICLSHICHQSFPTEALPTQHCHCKLNAPLSMSSLRARIVTYLSPCPPAMWCLAHSRNPIDVV